MNQAVKSNSLVESATLNSELNVSSMFKFSVTYKNDSIDPLFTNRFRSVVHFLQQDEAVQKAAFDDYCSHSETGAPTMDQLDEWIGEYLTEFATQAGYTIKEMK